MRGCESLEGLESSVEVVGSGEFDQVRFELIVGVVEVTLSRCFFYGLGSCARPAGWFMDG